MGTMSAVPRVELMPEAALRQRYGHLLFNRINLVGNGLGAVVFVKRSPLSCAFVTEDGHIFNVYTRPFARGRGLASLALSKLQESCKLPELTLQCHVFLEHWYRRHGFRRVEQRDEVVSMRWTNPRVKAYPTGHALPHAPASDAHG